MNLSSVIIPNTIDYSIFNPSQDTTSVLILYASDDTHLLRHTLEILKASKTTPIVIIHRNFLPWLANFAKTTHPWIFALKTNKISNTPINNDEFSYLKGNIPQGSMIPLTYFNPINAPNFHPPFNIIPHMMTQSQTKITSFSWDLGKYYPWLNKGPNQTLTNKASWLCGLYDAGRGILRTNIGFASAREIKSMFLIFCQELEENFEKTHKKLMTQQNSHVRLGWHGTSVTSAWELTKSCADASKQRQAYHGPCPLYLSEVTDKALLYALPKRSEKDTESALVLFKFTTGTPELRQSHELTREPIMKNSRQVGIELLEVDGIHPPRGPESEVKTNILMSPCWETMPREPYQICPIALIILNPLRTNFQ